MERKFIKHYSIMMVPGFVWLVLFNIVPMFGIVMAFQDFYPNLGFIKSPFVGLDNFRYMFLLRDVRQVFANTLLIAIGKIVGNLVFPLLFALMLNEVRVRKLGRAIQTITYLPYFLSWVILSGIILSIFGYIGPINSVRGLIGMEPILFFGRADLFRPIIISTDIWKSFGYNAVVYLAALTGIDPMLHEAAAIDGASRVGRLIHVTFPGILTTVVLLAILSMGNVLNAGFDQIFNLYNPLVYSTGDIIDTWVYRAGLENLQFSIATAVGLLKAVISMVLIVTGYVCADRFTGYKIF